MTTYIHYLKIGNIPNLVDKECVWKEARYTMIVDELYKWGYSQPLLKCVTKEQTGYIIREVHEGICGYHSGSRTMTTRILQVGYFCPTMEVDWHDFVKRCIPCQKHDNLTHVRQEELHHIYSLWPFAKRGMDILGPFTPGKWKVKFLLVGIYYFTKWLNP